MNYEQALDYIHSFKKFSATPSLSRMKALLSRLDNPQDKLKFVHVAGTNGKGSTVTMCSDILTKSRYKCGKFTSPFIIDFRERFQIDSEMISENEFVKLANKIKPHVDALTVEGVEINEFEAVTAIGFLYFAEQNCDIVVLEVGLGGRYDATNVISTAIVTAIVSISLDHTNVLGNTIMEIANEKAGIIKPNTALVCYPKQSVDAISVIMENCAKNNAQFIIPSLSSLVIQEQNAFGSQFTYDGEDYQLSLTGEHQIYNAITVLHIVKLLSQHGFEIKTETVKTALSNVHFFARFEVMQKKPLVVMDGAHNIDGITQLVKTLSNVKYERLFVIIGMLADKDYKASTKLIAELADYITCVDVNIPRSLSGKELSLHCQKYCDEVSYDSSLKNAIKQNLLDLSENDMLLCCGSLYMISDARKEWFDL